MNLQGWRIVRISGRIPMSRESWASAWRACCSPLPPHPWGGGSCVSFPVSRYRRWASAPQGKRPACS
jgi:hypothetical protein